MQGIALTFLLAMQVVVHQSAESEYARERETPSKVAAEMVASDVVNRKVDPRSPQALAFLDAYGTPSQQQIAEHHWPVAGLPLPDGLVRHKLSSREAIDEQPYVLLVDTDRKLMYLLKQEGNAAIPYGPVEYPRGPEPVQSANASPTSDQGELDLAEQRRLRRLETVAAPIPQRSGLIRGR